MVPFEKASHKDHVCQTLILEDMSQDKVFCDSRRWMSYDVTHFGKSEGDNKHASIPRVEEMSPPDHQFPHELEAPGLEPKIRVG